MSNKNLSIIFTGQGSQYPEMGTDLIEKYEWARERYSISSDILGYNVLEAQNIFCKKSCLCTQNWLSCLTSK